MLRKNLVRKTLLVATFAPRHAGVSETIILAPLWWL